MKINLDEINKIYVIGIKGSGIIAAVEILHAMGKEISGSDMDEKFFTDEILERLGIQYHEKFAKENVPDDADMVLYSSAYNAVNNPEMAEAEKKKLRMMSYPEMVEQFFNDRYGVAVSGTHGKTTTSAMLANALRDVGADPGAIIGSRVLNWGSNSLSGQGDFFVVEADEYQNKLRFYDPKAVILTSCDFDHPDYFLDFKEYKKAFHDFVAKIPLTGFLAVWGDSVDTLEVAKSCRAEVLTYGFGDENDYRVFNFQFDGSKQSFEIRFKDASLGKFEMSLVGKHNALNAAAVITVCHKLQLDLGKVRESLKGFRGTSRRFEYVGEYKGASVIDDYGHHPEEIKATLAAARAKFPEKNIWAVFHPHTFTRTKALLSEFSQSFSDADRVLVLDIYGSARETQGGVHSTEIVNLINRFDRDKAEYVPTIPETVDFLEENLGRDDVLITIGAGNVWEVGKELVGR